MSQYGAAPPRSQLLKRRPGPSARPVTNPAGVSDPTAIPSLYEEEQRLSVLEQEMEQLDYDLSDAIKQAGAANRAWVLHLSLVTHVLSQEEKRTSEDSRRSEAIIRSVEGTDRKPLFHEDTGLPVTGSDLWVAMESWATQVDVLRQSFQVKKTRSSNLQTIVNGLRDLTGSRR